MALCPVAGSPPQGTRAQRRLERAGRTRRSILIREEVVVAPGHSRWHYLDSIN
jgi:hypothetical protein